MIYKAHILIGSDSISKIGSKKSVINANPELYFQRFGEENELSVEAAEHAEQYLIKVEQPKSTCVTFNELRFDMYRSRKTPYVKLATIQSITAGTFTTLLLHYQDGHESSRQSI